MKLVLTGIQGSGKSTQGNLLSQQLNIPYLSTGHIFREIAKEKTALGRYLKETMNAGLLIPDDKVIDIVNDYLSRDEYKKGYILDGFPRTLRQAEEFKNNVDRVIYLEVPDKEALWRLAYRNSGDRQDETLPAIKKRIELFHKHTRPVIGYYETEKKLIVINGTKTIEEVNEEILKSLGKQLIKNQVKTWEKRQKTIIAIIGLPGAGKSEAADFFKKKGLPSVSFGRVINDYIDKHKLEHTEEVHNKLRVELRKKYGMEAMAVLNEKKIRDALEKSMIMLIDGLRSWEEYLYLKKNFPSVRIYLLAVHADKQIRHERSARRKYRSHVFGEQRDIDELIGANMGATIAYADFVVKNNFSLKDYYDKLEQIYRTIYFS